MKVGTRLDRLLSSCTLSRCRKFPTNEIWILSLLINEIIIIIIFIWILISNYIRYMRFSLWTQMLYSMIKTLLSEYMLMRSLWAWQHLDISSLLTTCGLRMLYGRVGVSRGLASITSSNARLRISVCGQALTVRLRNHHHLSHRSCGPGRLANCILLLSE